MAHAFAKYGVPSTAAMKRAMAMNPEYHNLTKRAGVTGDVVAIPQRNDMQYLSPVKVGTPPQTLYVGIDTGSADFPQPTSASTTSRLLPNHTWSILYGDRSSARGIVYRDDVTLGTTLHLPSLPIEHTTHVSPSFTTDPSFSGLLGLGPSHSNRIRVPPTPLNTTSPSPVLTVLDALLPSLSLPLFTADLRSQSPGTFTFGYIPRSSYLGSLSYTKLNPPRSPYWQFTVAGWSVGSGRSPSSGSGKPRRAFTAIADTGTSLALLPRKVVDDYYSRVPGAAYDARWAGVVFPCGVELPDWSFLLAEDGYRGVGPGRYMRYGKSSEGIGFGIFGDVVLKAQFVVFDVGGKRVGFGRKRLMR
ncbi:aspartic peptidase domain-containing protein [Schizothecium vesticola]|uniref:Aspartic peptidase domain-containing protein n=1 Tax=Schizothecium vesticola TaxID=314040 RepID=A0AA40BRH7_9PEZI|nr:aspartic peptidase domain-containing protein [Schizothecium vesticola]